jgi:uncharacterized protein YndB with AHSA1/START domain
MTTGRSTRTSQLVHAPREAVYRAFIQPEAVAAWLAPDTMRGRVETFEPRAGGMFRMSLTYLNPEDAPHGKTSAGTDTFEGKFVDLIPNTKIVWSVTWESDQPEFAGEMRVIWTLADADGGTDVTVLFEDIPAGIRLEDNELGSRQSLRKLAAYVEGEQA